MKRQAELVWKLKAAIRSHNLGAKHYERSDELLREIALELEPGQTIIVGSEKVTLIDEFEKAKAKGIAWRPCGFRRWSLERKPA